MGIRLAALFFKIFALMLLTASSSLKTSFDSGAKKGITVQKSHILRNHTGDGVVQNVRTGHGNGDGNGESPATSGTPGSSVIPVYAAAGAANSRNHHHHGAGINSLYTCNLSVLTATIFYSLLFLWA